MTNLLPAQATCVMLTELAPGLYHYPQSVSCRLSFPAADGFSRHWDENEFGPNLDYREHSFLNSSGLPHVIRESAVNVVVCTKGKGYCPEPDAPGTVDVDKIFLQENLLSEQIKL
jgi:hypothetical protein